MYNASAPPSILDAEVMTMEEKRDVEQGNRSFLKKQGFYIVLFLCLLIVGTAIVLTALPKQTEEDPQTEEQQSAVVETRQSEDETLEARATNSPLPTATPSPSPTPTATPRQASVSYTKKGSAPVSGDIIMGYAADQLLYSRTLDQWTTHPAIDIAAEVGTEVKATLAGTVERVYEDDVLGWTVQIAHTNDRASVYANLDEAVSVTEGQKVNAGDVIGKIGTSAISECADLPHLHFAFLVEGKAVDPTAYVNIPH